MNNIRKMSLRVVKDMAYKAFVMLGSAYRNKQKEKFLKSYD